MGECDSCCCICSLRTGSLIIAIIDLIGTLTVFIYAIGLVIDIGQTDENQNQNEDYWHMDHGIRFQIEDEGFVDSDQPLFYDDRIREQLFPEVIFLAVVSSTVIISDIVLFIGVLGGRFKPVVAWVWYAFVISCLTVMVIIWNSIEYRKATGIWKKFVFAIFYLVFKVYFMMVVRSYANTLTGGANHFNGGRVAVHPSTLPQVYPNGQHQVYHNLNVQQTVYPNGQPLNPRGLLQMHPNGQPPYSSGQQHQMYLNGPPPWTTSGWQQMYPNGQQAIPSVQHAFRNSQLPGPSEPPPPYSIGQSQMHLLQ